MSIAQALWHTASDQEIINAAIDANKQARIYRPVVVVELNSFNSCDLDVARVTFNSNGIHTAHKYKKQML